ncbi:MAG: STAS domain-containing protein [Microcoleaceae cyanobacterium MO_207.B10]|nr:STAS domain-containing protein [Microcoleaceae cyanobacterium MO_207.B10]
MTTVDINKHIILNAHHHLDLAAANSLKQKFTALLAEKYNLWIIDMTNVEFVDSCGLSALVVGLKTAREHNYRLVLCNLQPTVRLTFEITQLDRVFEIFDSIDAVFTFYDSKLAVA